MYELAKSAREKMKAKARSLAAPGTLKGDQKVDSSDWSPAEPLNADVKTGMRPISRRAYKKGGKVVGDSVKARADRKPRKSGGAMEKDIGVGMANKNMKQANEQREGIKHIGGLKKGGRTKKNIGGILEKISPAYALMRSIQRGPDEEAQTNQALRNAAVANAMNGRKKGGKVARAEGGRAKKADGGMLDDSRYASLQKVLGPSNIGNRAIGDFRQSANIARGNGPGDDKPMPAEGSLYKKGGKVARAEGGGVYDKKALGAIDPLPHRGKAQHYKKGGKIKKAGGGSFLERMVGKPKGSDYSDVGKSGTANYTQEDKGALNRAIRGDDALPAAGEAAERSGKYQNYNKGGRTGRASGGLAKELAENKLETKEAFQAHKDYIKKHGSFDPSDKGIPEKGFKKGGRTARDTGGDVKIPSTMHRFDDSGRAISPARYDIYNTRTGKVVGKAKSKIGSRRAVDRRDNDYGAYAHRAVPVYDDVSDNASEEKKYGGRTAKAGGGSLLSSLLGGKKKATKKAGKTDINIVINAGQKPPMRHPADMMPPPGADAGAPPMPPPGIGGPPPAGPPMMPPPGAGPGGLPGLPPGLPGRKAGGRISKVASSYKDMEAGSGGGEGRLQKTDIAKKHHDAPARKVGGRISKVAKSYKDMTAGAASGEGRLQKTDIAKAKAGRGK